MGRISLIEDSIVNLFPNPIYLCNVHVCCAKRLYRSVPVAAFLALLDDSATELSSTYGTNSSFMTKKLPMAETSLNMMEKLMDPN